jgi:hypothetical protein
MILLRILSFVLGLCIVSVTLRSAVRTYLLPRPAPDEVTRIAFRGLRRVFDFFLNRLSTYEERDRLLAYFSPLGMLALLALWLALVLTGYTFMYWALEVEVLGFEPWVAAFTLSGSSLFTLGYALAQTVPQKILTFSEAAMGPLLIALLIGYMPTIYGAFSKRESLVNMLEIRAGSPPSAVDMIARFRRLRQLEEISETWQQWEAWFSEIEETHTSLPMLNFFRSPVPEHSWVNAAGAVLDAAAIVASTVDIPYHVNGPLCIRAGYTALRRIADYFRIPYDPDPKPDDPISVTRAAFDHACEILELEAVPLKKDRDQCWRDFAGWRVNYDTVLLALARLTMAPPAPWSSPEMPEQSRPPTFGRGS